MKSLFTLILFLFCAGPLTAQVGIGTTTPSANAVLELRSPGNNQGFLAPRLTGAQRTALVLASADNGMLVFDSDDEKFYYWHDTQWLPIRSGADVSLQAGTGISITGNTISAVADGDGDDTNEIQDLQLVGNSLSITNNASATTIDLAPFAGVNTDNQTLTFNATNGLLAITGGNNVTITPTGAAAGDLVGAFPNPTIANTGTAGNNILSAVNNASTTGLVAANRLASTVVLDSETPTASDIGGSFSGGLSINNNAVTTAKINNAAVNSAKLSSTGVTAKTYGAATLVPQIAVDAQGRITSATELTISGVAPAGAATGDLAGTYPGPSIANTAAAGNNIINAVNNASTTGLIGTGRLATGVVLDSESPGGTSEISGNFNGGLIINGGAVTTLKLANAAVTTAKITDGNVTTVKVADNAITTAKIPDAAITTAKLLDGGVTTPKIGDAMITTIKISNGAVTGAKLNDTGVTARSYGTAALVPQLTVDAQGRITSASEIAIAGISPTGAAAGDLAGTYPNPSIANTATAGNNVINAINSATAGLVSQNRLASTVVLDSESPAGTTDIGGNFTGGLVINPSAVNTAKINNAAVTTIKIADANVTTAKLADAAITTIKIADNNITPAKIAPSVTPGQVLTTVAGATVWTNLPSITGGTVTSITAGIGLNGGVITGVGTISIKPDGVTSTEILSGTIVNSDISNSAGVVVSKFAPGTIDGQVVTTSKGSVVWSSPSPSVTNILTGTGLTGGPITDTGTISILPNGVTSTEIAAGTIINSDVSATADIAVSKLAGSKIDGQILTSVLGVPQWSPATSGSPGLGEVLATSPDAKFQPAINLKSVSINTSSTLGALNVDGSHFVSFTTFVDGYSVQPNDYILISSVTAKPAVIDLPKAAENKGRILIIRSQGRNSGEAVTVRAADGLDGVGISEPLWLDGNISDNVAYSLTIISNGLTWLTIDRGIADNRSKG